MATLQDRFNINSQLEHLQAKYVGTGHPDLQRFEWAGAILVHCSKAPKPVPVPVCHALGNARRVA